MQGKYGCKIVNGRLRAGPALLGNYFKMTGQWLPGVRQIPCVTIADIGMTSFA